MRVAAIQHRLRDDAEADAHALASAAKSAADRGAELIVLPYVASLDAPTAHGRRLLSRLLDDVATFCMVPSVDPAARGTAVALALPEPVAALAGEPGIVGLLAGDACMDPVELAQIAARRPSLAVLAPRSETDLQAEAMLELAIALSDSLAGIIVIAECAGAEPLEVGHGGSAIVALGEVVAEALSDDDVLLAELPSPLPQPSPREPLPVVPPLLARRLAHYRGQVEVEHGPDLS